MLEFVRQLAAANPRDTLPLIVSLASAPEFMVGAVFAGLEQMLDEASQKDIVDVFENPAVRGLGIASPKIEHPAAVLTHHSCVPLRQPCPVAHDSPHGLDDRGCAVHGDDPPRGNLGRGQLDRLRDEVSRMRPRKP